MKSESSVEELHDAAFRRAMVRGVQRYGHDSILYELAKIQSEPVSMEAVRRIDALYPTRWRMPGRGALMFVWRVVTRKPA
jgi:hypothetical protein